MHIIITDAWLARRQALHLNGWKLIGAAVLAVLLLMFGAVATYHWVFLEGIRRGWPGFESVARLVHRDNAGDRDAYLRANLDAMARKLGEMQARLMQIDALGERVSGLAGLEPAQSRPPLPGSGGALVANRSLTLEELSRELDALDAGSGARVDWLTAIESRLFDQKIQRSMVPTEEPVVGVRPGSPFGFRIDPITGQSALHTGLDFPADIGTPILAAAGGVVIAQEFHPAYGNLVEIDHGNNLVTRYAHASKVHVQKGDIVRRGQRIADVGNSGRSTGPHLHFEVWVAGVPQDPQKFLRAGEQLARGDAAAKAPAGR
ncbi:MAG: M23 family metallopeptidase [Hydrogenophaga sp.]|uniref:Peptidoglycan DD-metalloendopeptidase family protein n=1 Tax=Hydrogenophaga crocea TaxID=2716225 RepID=A0A6G8IMM4_9BURK|nr:MULTISPECIES: M23 family metallopeptidase [Hydrogenophaga]MBL0943131.1 M23 family metallopeptidase [Hydrogenophaga sp.]QIM54467.1 peptidoglycan DD-metalloendopeptidase family protein [Hydrogenophaga crocea]